MILYYIFPNSATPTSKEKCAPNFLKVKPNEMILTFLLTYLLYGAESFLRS